jgi:ATP-dependent helicase HrpB
MKQNEKLPLPIDKYLPEILTATRDYSTVLVKASPGSGKTTRLPWVIAQKLQKKVVVLEPRRLAARMAAMRIAEEENLALGQDVGFHFRFEKRCTENTPLIFYTEGTFLKKFLSQTELSDVEVVILDEFHERHLDTDLALAFLREYQKMRPELKIILMSATLDLKLVEAFPGAKVIDIVAPMFPVEVTYLPNRPSILNLSLEQKVKSAVEGLRNQGDILVFLPGMREMQKVQALLGGNVFLLHADLSREEQNLALAPSSQQKIILATNIAESSITIPGISIVIDSGIQREAHYSAWNGLKFIRDVPVTKSSAIQRAGRAGRTGPGQCLRLYAQQDFNEREEHTIPEIERADLTDTFLLVAGCKLKPFWFHAPSKEKWNKAKILLEKLGALEKDHLTKVGHKMLQIPLDARLSRVLIAGENQTSESKEKLLRYICDVIEEDRSGVLKKRLQFFLKDSGLETSWERCLLTGFIDQLAKFRSKQRDFIHYSGKIIKVHPSLTPSDDYYLILDITQRQEAISIFPVEEEWLWQLDPFPFNEEDEIEIAEKILIKRKTKIGSIVVEESIQKPLHHELSLDFQEKINQLSLGLMKQKTANWKGSPLYERYHFWGRKQNLDTDAMLDQITPKDYFSQNQNLNWDQLEVFLKTYLEEKLDISYLERELPQKINLGGARELVVHYPLGMEPYLEAPIQDFYGLNETPTIMGGKLPLTLKLLGPHKRPMQVTRDLKNFWQKTYQEMKKEYQRDYPRHYWPEKPWEAKPILLKRQLPKV